MDRRRRASSAASKSLLSRQLASITDTLAKASQRRDEEVKRARRPSKASTATAKPASPNKPAAPTQCAEPGNGQSKPMAVRLRGGADDNDAYHTPRLQEWEKADAVRKERKELEQTVVSSGPDDPERQEMIKYLLARSQLAKVRETQEVERKRLEEEEKAVDEVDQIIKREQEVDEFEELMLKEEEDMENEDYEERLRLWEEGRRLTLRMRAKDAARNARDAFLVKTNYEGQFKDPEDEKAELLRLEEEIFQHFVAQMQAEDARAMDEERKRERSEEAEDEARKKLKSGASPGDSAMALSSDEHEDEHSVPTSVHLRGGASLEDMIAAADEVARGFKDAWAEEERKINEDVQEMMAKMEALDTEREQRLERADRASRQNKDLEQTIATTEAKQCLTEVQRTSAEEAAREISATEEVPRRTEDADDRFFFVAAESPPRYTPLSHEASEFEGRGGNASQYIATMRGGEASSLDDPMALLAELRSLRSTVQLSKAESDDTIHGSDDPRQMLAEFDRPSVSVRANAAADDDPRRMLAELAALSAPGHQERRSQDYEDDEDYDINTVRARFEGLQSSYDRSAPLAPTSVEFDECRAETVTPTAVELDTIPYIVALKLEHSKIAWEHARGWTRCLFSSGLDSYEAQKAKAVAVAHAESALQKTISSVMAAEEQSRRKAEATTLQRRLIVSNLAAGADEEEMERQFWKHRYDIVSITFLPDRDPLKRTHTAHVDFSSRKAAVQASFISGQVYGLIFSVELAQPVERVLHA